MQANNKISGMLSIARKANATVIGLDKIKLQKKPCQLILVCSSASEKLKKEANYFQTKLKSDLIELDNLEHYIHIDNCKIVGINNIGIATSLKQLIRGEI